MMGTTSACAENTGQNTSPEPMWWNYLRVRGEYHHQRPRPRQATELPPRARRIQIKRFERSVDRGTTSACAENTSLSNLTISRGVNYLRVRGEYTPPRQPEKATLELPPRARRIPHHFRINHAESGTTSACAENTLHLPFISIFMGNYLRVRGEYAGDSGPPGAIRELPPRARRILVDFYFSS